MQVLVSEIFRIFESQGILTEWKGKDVTITGISPVEDCMPGDLVFVDRIEFFEEVIIKKPSAVVVRADLVEESLKHVSACLVSGNVNLAHALIRQKFQDRNYHQTEFGSIHSSCVIHPDVKIPASCVIGPGAVIGKNVKIGENTVIMAQSVVEYDAEIGDDVIIHPRVVIGYGCKIGNRCVIKSGAVIGSEGFGFAQDSKRRSYKVPQTGIVVIEEDVAVGAQCCIDRATFKETRIGRGTKMDNLCHVAHNVQIGQDCLLTAGFVVAGSTVLGNRVLASGQVGVLDHLDVCDDVVLLHRAGVTENITTPGMYAGLPAQPLQRYLRNVAILRGIGDMKKTIHELEKKVKLLEEELQSDK